MRKYDRYLIRARLKNSGGFSNETMYRIKLASGEYLNHIGFTSYTFDQTKKRNPDAHWEGEVEGFVEVAFFEMEGGKALVMPPQVHGLDHSGIVYVAKNDLQLIPKSQWNNHDSYGVK